MTHHSFRCVIYFAQEKSKKKKKIETFYKKNSIYTEKYVCLVLNDTTTFNLILNFVADTFQHSKILNLQQIIHFVLPNMYKTYLKNNGDFVYTKKMVKWILCLFLHVMLLNMN